MNMKKYDDFVNEAKGYKKILKEYKKTGKQYIDSNFHPSLQIPESKLPNLSDSMDDWKRVDEIYPSPLFKKELINPDFIKQGNIGDCYFISALSRIAMQNSLVQRLFKKKSPNKILGTVDDSINIKCGAVVIYFYCFGKKIPVLIDTLLPINPKGKPIFSHLSNKTKSPWFCLVEKAYAKFNGSYSNIICNSMSRAIYSLSNYYPRYKNLQNLQKPEKINKMSVFDRFMKYQEKGVIMSCLLGDIDEDEAKKKGLVTDHVYLLMKVRIECDKQFFCLRNPWGSFEWNGDWSKNSNLWTPELIDRLDVSKEENGTFWMIDTDFFKYFHHYTLSYPTPPKSKSKKLLFQLPANDNYVESSTYIFELINELPKNEKFKINFVCQRINNGGNSTENLHYELFINDFFGNNQFFYENNSTIFTYSKNLIGKNPKIEFSFRRTGKSDFIDDLYLRVFCPYKFNLYEKNNPGKICSEDENIAVVFNNFSPRHKVGRQIVIKNIDGKDTLVLNSSPNDISEIEKEKVSKVIAGYTVSNSSSPVDSPHNCNERINLISEKKKDIPNDGIIEDLSDESIINYSFDESTTIDSFDESTTKDLSDYSTTMESLDESTTKESSDDFITKDLSDESTTKESSDDFITKDLSDDDITKDLSDNDTVKNLPDNDTVKDLPNNDTVKNLPNNDTVKNLSDDDTIKNLPNNDTVKDLSDDDTIKNLPDNDTVKNLSDDDTVKNLSDDDTVKNLPDNNIENLSDDTIKDSPNNEKNLNNVYYSINHSPDTNKPIDKQTKPILIFQYLTEYDEKIKNNHIKKNNYHKSLPPIYNKEKDKKSKLSLKLSFNKKSKNINSINQITKCLKPKEIIQDKSEYLRKELTDFDKLINQKIKLIKKMKNKIKLKENEINSIKDRFEKEKKLVIWETQKLEYKLEKENLLILKTQYNQKKQQYFLEKKKFNEASNSMPLYEQRKIIKPKYSINLSQTPPIIKTNHIDLLTPKNNKQIKRAKTTFVPLYITKRNMK